MAAPNLAEITDEDGQVTRGLVVAGSDVVQRFRDREQIVNRPGLSGNEYLKLGQAPAPHVIRFVTDATNASEARQLLKRFEDMKTQVVKFKDGFGRTWVDSAGDGIHKVLRVTPRMEYAPNGTGIAENLGSSNYLVFADLVFELISDPTSE